MKINAGLALCLALFVSGVAGAMAADFDGDGVADEFTLTRDAAKVAKEANVRLSNPWGVATGTKLAPKGVGLVVRLSRTARRDLLYDPEYFGTPMWEEARPPLEVITKKDRRHRAWKKEVPALQHDAIELGTEAGIDILLYWDGKQWRVFWPDNEG